MFWCVVSLYIFNRCFALRVRQNTAQLVKIHSDTKHQNIINNNQYLNRVTPSVAGLVSTGALNNIE